MKIQALVELLVRITVGQELHLWIEVAFIDVLCSFCTAKNTSPEKKPEHNPLVPRNEENTKEIRSILHPSILRLFLGPLVIWPKV
jgi:hypothetical protein